MDLARLQALHDEMRAVIAALRAGEIARANEMLAVCEVPKLAASGAIPAGPEGDALRATVDEALALAVTLQTSRRAAVTQGGATRRALGAYATKRR